VRQQLVDALGGRILQAREVVGERSLRIDVVELGCLDQRVDGGGTAAALVRPREGPVVATDRDAAQRLSRLIGRCTAAAPP
jgi:hypothetical protein